MTTGFYPDGYRWLSTREYAPGDVFFDALPVFVVATWDIDGDIDGCVCIDASGVHEGRMWHGRKRDGFNKRLAEEFR